ncbi:hypothetical protein FPV67DRAFT_1443587 [Lyophyllum atratum]|nr:hypothetical protein FPV67DRAFT_1443587 [Lyophyllum atratum]
MPVQRWSHNIGYQPVKEYTIRCYAQALGSEVITLEVKVFCVKRQEIIHKLQNVVAPETFSPHAVYHGKAIMYASAPLQLPGGRGGNANVFKAHSHSGFLEERRPGIYMHLLGKKDVRNLSVDQKRPSRRAALQKDLEPIQNNPSFVPSVGSFKFSKDERLIVQEEAWLRPCKDHEFLIEAGMVIETKAIPIKGKILETPNLSYVAQDRSLPEPRDTAWNFKGAIFCIYV